MQFPIILPFLLTFSPQVRPLSCEQVQGYEMVLVGMEQEQEQGEEDDEGAEGDPDDSMEGDYTTQDYTRQDKTREQNRIITFQHHPNNSITDFPTPLPCPFPCLYFFPCTCPFPCPAVDGCDESGAVGGLESSSSGGLPLKKKKRRRRNTRPPAGDGPLFLSLLINIYPP